MGAAQKPPNGPSRTSCPFCCEYVRPATGVKMLGCGHINIHYSCLRYFGTQIGTKFVCPFPHCQFVTECSDDR